MRQFYCIMLLVGLSAGAPPVLAAGAIAVGLPADVAKNGFAAGTTVDFPSTDLAGKNALKRCKSGEGAPASTRALCRTVATFVNKCAVIAADPRPKKPGFGWAVAGGSNSAGLVAMNKCRATGGQGCKVVDVSCDGSGK